MKIFSMASSLILIAVLSAASALAQRNASVILKENALKENALKENAALRYWSAFSEVQDSAITDQQAKELNSILDGTAPYDDSKYKDLLEKNALALEIMARATSLPDCEWGLDYGLGHDLPVDYARKALLLGRLNVLYAFHLLKTGNKSSAVRALAAGMRFSHDVANGGSLFATLIAKDLLVTHLRAVAGAIHLEQLSADQRAQLQASIARLGEGLDWPAAARRDLEALRGDYAGNQQSSAALTRIISSYVAALNDESRLAALNQVIEGAPQEFANAIPDAKRVLEQKQDLTNALLQTRALLQ